MVNKSFAFRKTKTCRQHDILMLRLTLVAEVPLWLNGERHILNDQNNNTTQHYMKRWARTDFSTLTLPLAAETRTREWEKVKFVSRFTNVRLVNQEDFCGAIPPTYFVENCLGNENISKVLVILFPIVNQFTCHKTFLTFTQTGIYR